MLRSVWRRPRQPLWHGPLESVHVLLEPQFLGRVAAQAFDLDPGKVTLPVGCGVSHPQIQAAVPALDPDTRRKRGGGWTGQAAGSIRMTAGCRPARRTR
jgi:hypothetical protein